MSYAMFDDGWYDHPHFLELSLDALGLWSVGKTYCSKHLTDGKIPASIVRRYGRKGQVAATELVKAGRWTRLVNGDYEHVGYLDHNASKEEVEARKEAQRLAKSESGRKGGLNSGRSRREAAASSKPPSRTEAAAEAGLEGAVEALSDPLRSDPIDLPPNPPPGGGPVVAVKLVEIPAGVSRNDDGVPVEPPEPEEPPTREQEYQRAYETGVAKATGAAYAMPEKQRGELHQAIGKFAKGGKSGKALRGPDVLEWVDAAAEDFTRWLLEQAKRDERAIGWYSAGGPKGMLKWLNEEALRQEARRVG